MNKPRKVLDLFCGGGGIAKGYADAGFEVVGVDLNPQPSFPYQFVQDDAIDYLIKHWDELDHYEFIHASPPCQAYSVSTFPTRSRDRHPDLLPIVRELLAATGRPYVIENVPGAPMRRDLVLFGWMFGLPLIRQRWFEISGFWIMQPQGQRPKGSAHAGDFVTVAGKGHSYNCKQGHNGPKAAQERRIKCWKGSVLETWRHAMATPWMQTRKEIANSIPPPYAKYIGDAIMDQIKLKEQWTFEIGTDPDLKDRIFIHMAQAGRKAIDMEVWTDKRFRHNRPTWLWQKESDATYRPAAAAEIREALEGFFPLSMIEAVWGPRAEPAAMATCANPKCKSPAFVPKVPKQAYCSTRCRVAGLRAKRDKSAKSLLPIEQSPISDKWAWIKITYCVHRSETWFRIDIDNDTPEWITGHKVVCSPAQLPMRIKEAVAKACAKQKVFAKASDNAERNQRATKLLSDEIDAHFKAMGYDVESKTLGALYEAERSQPQLTPQ